MARQSTDPFNIGVVRIRGRSVRLGRFASPGADEGSELRELERAHGGARDALGRLELEAERVEQDRRLSSEGKAEKLRELAGRERRTIRRLREAAVAPRRERLQKLREGLQPVEIDKTDVAAAMRRSEIRAHLRGLSPDKRHTLLDEEPEFSDAALEVPALAGIGPEHARSLRERAVKKRHPEALAEAQELEAALSSTEEALTTADRVLEEFAKGEVRGDGGDDTEGGGDAAA